MSLPRICPHYLECSGCTFWQSDFNLALQEQQLQKLNKVWSEFKKFGLLHARDIQYLNPNPTHYRNHLDYSYLDGKFGLYHLNKTELVDIHECFVLTPMLQDQLTKLRKISFPIRRGSIRLRVDPHGRCGLWLDFANEDIRDLLSEKKTLLQALDLGFVEIGQKGKTLGINQGILKMSDPTIHPWFQTKFKENKIDLFSLVSSFTQSGIANNLAMMSEIQSSIRQLFNITDSTLPIFRRAAEFGAGIGNLTLPFLEFTKEIHCFEQKTTGLQAFRVTLESPSAKAFQMKERITIHEGDFRKTPLDLNPYDALILNPSRSGVGQFAYQISEAKNLNFIFYMSCFLESFQLDSQIFISAGFKLKKLTIFDQFSFSQHFEILSFWVRD